MLCGEYAVLNGASAFALPTKAGQSLHVEVGAPSDSPVLTWKAINKNGEVWFQAKIALPYFIVLEYTEQDVSIQLLRFLINAKALNPNFLSESKDVQVTTNLEFHNDEGLGSSSTLTNNIAQWAQVNPFSLHFNAFKGSGFDVAVAHEGKPLLYTMNGSEPKVETLEWNKPFRDKLYFVHLNKKQNSRLQIANYKRNMGPAQVAQITRISKLISINDDYFEFCLLLELAENEMSQVLGMPCIKQELFEDFNGTVKSLGAWGGDYVLATGEDTLAYFQSKEYHRIIPFNDLIL
jgi:mevalonate kinase